MTEGKLPALLDRLEERFGRPPAPPTRDPFGLLLLENLSYPADDERAARAFHALRDGVGATPKEVAAAPIASLRKAAALGGIFPDLRAKRLKECALRVVEDHGGDLAKALRADPARAARALREFPTVGEPGADRLLMAAGLAPVLGLDSNALRVLLRLGFGKESRSFAKDYRSARDAAAREIPERAADRTRAFLLLKRHGKEVCRRSRPACDLCPMRPECAYARGQGAS